MSFALRASSRLTPMHNGSQLLRRRAIAGPCLPKATPGRKTKGHDRLRCQRDKAQRNGKGKRYESAFGDRVLARSAQLGPQRPKPLPVAPAPGRAEPTQDEGCTGVGPQDVLGI